MKGLEISIMTGRPYSSFLTQKKKIRDFSTLKIGLNIGREELYDRINLRVDQIIKKGLLEEARGLYPYRELNALKTVGYRELFSCFDGKISLDKAIDLIKRNTRRFAKRQLTWFQRDKDIHWFQPSEIEKIFELSQLFQVS
jgi:tRNA dimethylallyltransferase